MKSAHGFKYQLVKPRRRIKSIFKSEAWTTAVQLKSTASL